MPDSDKSIRFADIGLIIAEGIIYSHDKIAFDKFAYIGVFAYVIIHLWQIH